MDYQKLFDYMKDEHGVTLLESDMQEIRNIVCGHKSEQCNIPDISKRFIVMYEDGRFYDTFTPLGIWETRESSEIAANKWKRENPSKQTYIEEVDYNSV